MWYLVKVIYACYNTKLKAFIAFEVIGTQMHLIIIMYYLCVSAEIAFVNSKISYFQN